MGKKTQTRQVPSVVSKWWEYATLAYTTFILVCFPLVTDSTGFSAITACKFRNFWISTVIYFGAVLLPLLYVWVVPNQRNKQLRKTILPKNYSISQLFIGLYLLWSIISAIASPWGKDVIIGQGRYDGLVSTALYTFAFLFVSFWGKSTTHLFRGVTVMGIIFSLISILQLFVKGIIYPQGYWYWDVRFLGTIGNVDMVAGLAAVFIPVLFTFFVFEKDKKWNYVHLVGILLFMFVQTFADADSGKVGIAFGLLLVTPFLFDTKEHMEKALLGFAALFFGIFLPRFLNISQEKVSPHMGGRAALFLALTILSIGASLVLYKVKIKLPEQKKMQKLVALALVVLIVIGLVVVFFYSGDNRLLTDFSEVLHGRLSDNAGSNRGILWKNSLKVAAQRPILGWGPGCFFKTFYPYDTFTTNTDFAHNDFIQIAFCTGFVSLAFYVAFVLTLAFRTLKNANKNYFLIVLGASAASYLAHSFFSFSIGIITPMFWAFAGLLEKELLTIKAKEKEALEKAE